jgi:hypothetical protein
MMFTNLIYRKIKNYYLTFVRRRAMMVKIESEGENMNNDREMALLRRLGNVNTALANPMLTPWARGHWNLTRTILQRRLSDIRVINSASSSNGRTMDFDSINRGSNP